MNRSAKLRDKIQKVKLNKLKTKKQLLDNVLKEAHSIVRSVN